MKKFFVILPVCVASVLASCTANDSNDDSFTSGPDRMIAELTGEEAISLMADKTYTLSDDEVLQIVETFASQDVPSTETYSTRANTLRIVDNYALDNIDGVPTRFDNTGAATVFSVVSLGLGDNGDSGIAVVCRDSRYPEVLAYAPNADTQMLKENGPMQLMMTRAHWIALKYIEKCNEITAELRETTLKRVCQTLGISTDKFDFSNKIGSTYIKGGYDIKVQTVPEGTLLTAVGPLCGNTRLIQGWPCNQFIPETTLKKYDTEVHHGHFPAGCVNVALATICSYLRPTIYSSDLGRNINWDYVYDSYFNPYSFNAAQYDPDTPQAKEVGYLLKILANGTKTTFNENGGSTTTSNAASYMKSIGVDMSSSTSKLIYTNVRPSLANKYLVFCMGKYSEQTRSDSGELNTNHTWVIDGLQIRKPLTRMELQNYNCYANCKFGWIEWDNFSMYDGWYLFDTDGTITFKFDGSEQIAANLSCIPNIKLK